MLPVRCRTSMLPRRWRWQTWWEAVQGPFADFAYAPPVRTADRSVAPQGAICAPRIGCSDTHGMERTRTGVELTSQMYELNAERPLADTSHTTLVVDIS